MSCREARDQRDHRATPPAAGVARAFPPSADRDAEARSFYGAVLQGQQVWPTECAAATTGLWFLVGGTLVEVRAARDAGCPPITLAVDTPDAMAARCWDAGFDVRVTDDASGRAVLSVIDPFGRELVLVCRESPVHPQRRLTEG